MGFEQHDYKFREEAKERARKIQTKMVARDDPQKNNPNQENKKLSNI